MKTLLVILVSGFIGFITVFVIATHSRETKKTDTAESETDNDTVLIEYQCSMLDRYEYVPPEVYQECKSRGFFGKNNT